MATTSIWSVKGQLGKVVRYVQNPDKTQNPEFYAPPVVAGKDEAQRLTDVIEYAVNEEKTQKSGVQDDLLPATQEVTLESQIILQRFVSGINCSPNTAPTEMMAVKKRFGKEGGVVAYHGYQSFAPGEATPEQAHEIGVKLAQRLWGEKYQVLVATHLDKMNHLHSHFVVNTVSFLDGIRYHRTAKDYHDMQAESDRLCREYGLSVIEKPAKTGTKTQQYAEWQAQQEQRPTWRGLVRADLDAAIATSRTEKQFFDTLRKKGYAVKVGKDISVRPQGKERFLRLARNFGEDYTMEGIRQRLLSQPVNKNPLLELPSNVEAYTPQNRKQHNPRKAPTCGTQAEYVSGNNPHQASRNTPHKPRSEVNALEPKPIKPYRLKGTFTLRRKATGFTLTGVWLSETASSATKTQTTETESEAPQYNLLSDEEIEEYFEQQENETRKNR